jgi:ABC-type glutathione transport system ATPase component
LHTETKPACHAASRAARTRSPARRGPSDRLLQAAALFGLRARPDGALLIPAHGGHATAHAHATPRARHDDHPASPGQAGAAGLFTNAAATGPGVHVRLARELDKLLQPGQIALVTGPSGAGKSRVLAALARRLGRHALQAATGTAKRRRGRPVVDLFSLPLTHTLGTLSRAGLAEARLLGLRPDQLSEGQRFRLALALAMARAGVRRPRGDARTGRPRAPLTLIADEFCSTLDRPTAMGVCLALRRWAASAPALRIVVATAHDDVAEWLAPDVTLRAELVGPATLRGTRCA